ncbi:MAG: hypothetical protein Fur0032_04760 [Terrimicrobiaceae bacterium]
MKNLTMAFLLAVATQAFSQNLDKIRLTDGREIAADIQKLEGRQLVVSRTLDFGRSVERYPIDTIAMVTFAGAREADSALAQPTSPARTAKLSRLWETMSPFLTIPGSPAGRVGLAYARALAESSLPADRQKAVSILSLIETGDWLADRRSDAFSEKLLVLLAQGQGDEAKKAAEAALQADGEPNPRLRAGASYSLALILRKELADLEKENPRWELDPAIRPVRNRLYHRIIELLLIPYLENGLAQASASRSLWELADFHQSTGNPAEALSVARDISEIYPSSPEAVRAKSLLQTTDNQP